MIAARGPNREALRDRLMLVILALIAVVSVATAAIELMHLIDRQAEREAALRDDVAWLVMETDRDLRALHAQADLIASGAEIGRHEALLHHFDDLVRHVGQLSRGSFALDIAAQGRLSAWSRALTLMIADLAPQLRALDPAAPTYRVAAAAIATRTAPWTNLSARLMEHTVAGAETQRQSDAVQRARAKDRLVITALLLLLAFIGICALLCIQLRKLARANRHFALLQERSKRNATRARAASTAKSAFLAAMSHEIRTPLNAIIGSAELLALRTLPEGTDRQLCTITAQAFLLRDLIDGVLDFSRLDARQIETRRTETDLAALGDLLTQAFADEARRAGLAFQIDMPPAQVMVDGARLRQILVNLIGNALKFTPEGRVTVRGTMPHPGLLRITVEDTGIGIPEDEYPRLFREFSRIDASNARSQGGSGLGLAICRRVVAALGGRIGVQSAPGLGSLFWVELPVTTVAVHAAAPAPDPVPPPVPARSLRILVAEDNAINLEVAEGLLRHMGHSVIVVRDGQAAVSAATTKQPDLVLMDMQMPVMDGLQAARTIRKTCPDLPIIAVTANVFPQDRRACLAAGMSGFLPKPLTLDTLAAVIADHGPPLPDDSDTMEDGIADLVAELGTDMLGHLLDRFAAEIDALQLANTTAADQEAALHSLKGAALTLRLARTAAVAQALRNDLPADENQFAILIATARSDIAAARDCLRNSAQFHPAPGRRPAISGLSV